LASGIFRDDGLQSPSVWAQLTYNERHED